MFNGMLPDEKQKKSKTYRIMVFSIYFALLFLWVAEDVSGEEVHWFTDVLTVRLGDSLTLNCTYNCSAGFIRGCWNKEIGTPRCHTGPRNRNGFCTVSLYLYNVTEADLTRTYKCYTVQTDDPHLLQEIQHIVALQLQNGTYRQDSNEVRELAPSAAHPTEPKVPTEDQLSFGEFSRINILAAVSVLVAVLLAALIVCLYVKQSRRFCTDKEFIDDYHFSSPLPTDTVPSSVKGAPSVQREKVTLMIPPSDGNSDVDVPYADIVITVRGVSTPELTQVNYMPVGDPRQRWGMDSRCHLHASRSADRLHIPPPREVSRKISTGSEYAVISYV